MKVKFEFSLPDDQREYEIMNQSEQMLSVLSDFNEQLRSWQKYGHRFENTNDALDKIREEWYRLLNYNEVNIDL